MLNELDENGEDGNGLAEQVARRRANPPYKHFAVLRNVHRSFHMKQENTEGLSAPERQTYPLLWEQICSGEKPDAEESLP